MTIGRKIGSSLLTALIVLVAIIWMLPVYLLITLTFKQGNNVLNFAAPPDFTYWGNYTAVFKAVNIPSAFLTTLLITGCSMFLIILFGSMAGYAIGRSKHKLFRWIYLLFAMGLIIPAQSNMIPIYKIGVGIGLINTPWFMILMYTGGAAFASFIYAGYVKGIPEALEEAAAIDGCGFFRTYIRIVFPLLMPATGIVLAIQTFWYWNDYQGPLIYLNSPTFRTLTMAIYNFRNLNNKSTAWGPLMALCLIMSLPVLIIYLFAQKSLIKGVVVGSVKG